MCKAISDNGPLWTRDRLGLAAASRAPAERFHPQETDPMRTEIRSQTIVALSLLVAGSIALSAAAAPRETHPTAACATWTTDTIRVGNRIVPVTANYEQDIGDSLTAVFPPDSRVQVTSIKRNATNNPYTAQLTLNAEYAVAGEWKMSLTGPNGSCSGNYKVENPIRK
jgi:hypothetical protein